MIRWFINRAIDKSEKDTGYPADYLREILSASKLGFFKLGLALQASHPRHAGTDLHLLAQLGAMQQEACGPCLDISRKYAQAGGIPEIVIQQLLANPHKVERQMKAAFLLGQHVAGGEPLAADLLAALETAVGRAGVAELTVSASIVRIFPALKRGLGYSDMCAIPQSAPAEDLREKPAN